MPDVSSSFHALKELFAIVAAVAIANVSAVSAQLASGGPAKLNGTYAHGFDNPSSLAAASIGWCLVLLCIRFYHGNYRIIDEELSHNGLPQGPSPESAALETSRAADNTTQGGGAAMSEDGRWLVGNRAFRALEFATVVGQGVVLTTLGQAVQNAGTLFDILFVLFVSDVLLAGFGFMATGVLSRPRRVWLGVNVVSIVLLGSQTLFFLPFSRVIVLVLICGFAFDYAGNWSFYFPTNDEAAA